MTCDNRFKLMVARFDQYRRNSILLVLIIIFVENFFPDDIRLQQSTNLEEFSKRKGWFPNAGLFTSVWCRGQNHSHRICRFTNLCFNPRIRKFLFFHDTCSIISGVPKERFDPAIVDFSSVEDHNTQYFNYVDIPSTAVDNFNITLLEGHALILKRFNPDNLMHVFHDDLLPVYFTLLEVFGSFEKENVYLAFADDRNPGPYHYLYSDFINSKPLFLINENPDKILCFKSSYIGLNKQTTWYQYGFSKPQGKIEKDMTANSKIIKMFCSYFKKQFNIMPSEVSKKVVLFDRRNNRKVINKNEVVSLIEQSTKLQVETVALETHDLMEIIGTVSQSSAVIGMHGSLLILCMFLSPGSVVVELFPYAIDSHIYTPYKTLATLDGMNIIYAAWENKFENNSVPHPDNPPEFGGIHHLSPEEQEPITESSQVPPHLCCYNPEWLYRIYQDTVVDIESLGKVLKSALDVQQTLLLESHHSVVSKPLKNVIYPDEVQNVSCGSSHINENHSKLILSWRPPWNLQFMEHHIVEYEIWCQLVGTEDVRAFITRRTQFTLPELSQNSFHVWIRCNIDGLSGPFTSNPLICFGSNV